MPRSARLVASSTALSLTLGVVHVSAQSVAPRADVRTPVAVEVSMRAGLVTGSVRDDRGTAVAGVAVTAIGTTQAQVRTDAFGHFRLALVPGDYILRASRDGYVSPYRESVRIRSAAQIERNITIMKQPGVPDRTVLLAGVGPAATSEPLPVESVVPTSGRLDALQAWYLRHLPRTVLRDGASHGIDRAPAVADLPGRPSILDRILADSARAATSFFVDTDFSGQFNMLTTSALDPLSGWNAELPRGVAYLAVGAPVGTHGDWRIRGALSTGGLASWVAMGEYITRDVQTHAFRAGMSYGAQRVPGQTNPAVRVTRDNTRSAASLYAVDHWQVAPRLALTYGLRADRYDYVSGGQHFLSPRIGTRVGLWSRTWLTVDASSAVIAPGVDAFLPPPSSGPWLPPDRTFTALVAGAELTPERVHRTELGLAREFGMIGRTTTISARGFYEHTRDQLATVFGTDAARGVGHYYVAAAGDVTLLGWGVRASGWFTARVNASIDYSVSRATWEHGAHAVALAVAQPSALRPRHEVLHDVTGALRANIPESGTDVVIAYRFNTVFAESDRGGVPAMGLERVLAGRFDVQVRQALPFQPIQGGRVDVLIALSNMFREPPNGGLFASSSYDELLATRAPRRVLGGVQVRF